MSLIPTKQYKYQGDNMKKFTSTLFLALILAISASLTFAQTAPTGGQIPIGGRIASEPKKSTAAEITTTVEQKQETSTEISNYLWTIVSVLRHFKF